MEAQGREGGRDPRGLPQHLQLLRGVLRLVLEAPPAQACPQLLLLLGLVGGQLLKPQTQTHVHKTPSLLPLCQLRAAWVAAALFLGGWQRRPPATPAPHRTGQEPRASWVLEEEPAVPRLAACSGGTPGPGIHPALERAGFPRGHFHSDAIQPFLLCVSARGGEGPQPPFLLRAVYCGAC